MSYQAVRWAMYDAPMPVTDAGRPDSTARQVLSVVAEHADEHGRNAHPSPLRIAYATGLDERTVTRALRRLELAELIARDGVARNGCTRWKLAMAVVRPESEWEVRKADADEARRVESEARQARRNRTAINVSGTQTAGHSTVPYQDEPDSHIGPDESVRDADSRRPGRRVPDVRHAAPPEPPEQPPTNHPLGVPPPPDPRDPTGLPAARTEPEPTPEDDHHEPITPRTTTHAARDPDPPPLPERCAHGLKARRRPDGTSSCTLCRQGIPAPPEALARVIPLRRPA